MAPRLPIVGIGCISGALLQVCSVTATYTGKSRIQRDELEHTQLAGLSGSTPGKHSGAEKFRTDFCCPRVVGIVAIGLLA